MPRLLLTVLAVACAANLRADDWPQFRGPTADGISTAKALPTTWSEKENIRWKVAIHDKGWSSPVVAREQVWVTTAHEKGTAYFAVALDRKTGTILHDLHLFDVKNPPDTKQYNSFASPTPCIDDGRVYAHFGSAGTACIEMATGNVLWKRSDLPCDHFRNAASSPVVYKNLLFLTFDGFDKQYVAALDKLTGKNVWVKDRTLPFPSNGDFKKAFATPSILAVNGQPQLVTQAATGTLGLDPQTGEELWRVITGGMNQANRPILAHGLIYITSGHTGNLLAVSAGGRGDLTKSGIQWRFDKVAPTKPSLLIVGDLLFLVNDGGVAYCLDAKTGAKRWQERLDGKFAASPVYAAGNIYACGENGTTSVFAATPEYGPVAKNKLDAGCMASPAVAGGDLFLRTLTHLYCIGAK